MNIKLPPANIFQGLSPTADPLSVDQPPTSNQKAHMRKSEADHTIIRRITWMYVKSQVAEWFFGTDLIPTIESYMPLHGRLEDGFTASEWEIFHRLTVKAQMAVEPIQALRPQLWGIPYHINMTGNDIYARTKTQPKHHFYVIACKSYESMKFYFDRQQAEQIFISTYFYMLDLDQLLNHNRDRGTSIPRWLKVFASHTMNQLIHSYFREFVEAYRYLVVDGFDEDKITFMLLLERMGELKK